MPRDFFTEQALDNLRQIICNKQTLLLHALCKADTAPLDITETDDKIEFPWFTPTADGDSAAYTQFITLLCKFAKERKRVAVKSSSPDNAENADFNEKYAFRCFLLRIGMIGAEYKAARKVLLRNLTGSSTFKNGTASSDTAAENGGKIVETYLIISTKPR